MSYNFYYTAITLTTGYEMYLFCVKIESLCSTFSFQNLIEIFLQTTIVT